MFGLTKLGQPLVRYVVGNGTNATVLWLDFGNWDPLGPPYKTLGNL